MFASTAHVSELGKAESKEAGGNIPRTEGNQAAMGWERGRPRPHSVRQHAQGFQRK